MPLDNYKLKYKKQWGFWETGKMKEKKLDIEAVLALGQTEEDIKIDRQLAMTCHMLGFITGVFGPLIFFFTKKEDAEFLRHHEREALNFQITMFLAAVIAIYLDIYVLNHMYFTPVIFITDSILSFTAVMKANADIYYNYPVAIPFFKRKH